VGKICDFRLKSPFILETVRDRPRGCYGTLTGVIGGGSIRIGSDDLEWPLTRVSRSLYTNKSNISKWCILETKLL